MLYFRKIDLCSTIDTSSDEISISSVETCSPKKKRKCISERNTDRLLEMKEAHYEGKKQQVKESRDEYISVLREIQVAMERQHQEKIAVKERKNNLLEQLLKKL